MNTATICILLAILVYLGGMILIGVHYARKNSSASDFCFGRHRLGPFVTAMSRKCRICPVI